MEKYVTVVSVDDQQQEHPKQPSTDVKGSKEVLNGGVEAISNGSDSAAAVDSQFVTVLSINHGGAAALEGASEPELVLVYRLPGERLGFGLKFQGGTKNNEKIQRLFIQSCAENSPASRVQASWGFLREGDEILEIDGVSVTRMTRIECVKCLKESNLAIKLLVRNGEGKVQNFFDENGDVPEKKSVPPPPPPVPPRKLNKRKVVEQHAVEPPAKQVVEIVHPPDAEVYSNLFSDDISDLISESDDTASTISTVIDKNSICSSLSSEDYTISSNPSSLELAKALKPFTLLEQEFNLEDKLETNLFTFQPSAVNIVQVEVGPPSSNNEYENVSIAKVDENKNYENVVIQASDHHPQNYENVTIQEVVDVHPYENVVIPTSDGQPESTVYENVDLKPPPRPAPRQGALVEPKRRAAPLPTEIIPPPRQKSHKFPPQLPHEFNTIQSWLQEATEVIHECALAPHAESPKDDKRTGSNESLPRLIDFHPKVSSPFKPVSSSPQPSTIITVDDAVRADDDGHLEPEPEPTTVVIKKCIKISTSSDDQGQLESYIESSSSDSDEDEEKSYEPHAFRHTQQQQQRYYDAMEHHQQLYEDEHEEEERRSCDGSGGGGGAFDTYSDEDGEKLGPPEIVAGGPSEAYFNFHWSTTLLPPIGEVEEEFSSLENQQSGPIVIIDTAEETLFNDSNNNQHREPKAKLNGHHEYVPELEEEDEPFPSAMFVGSQEQQMQEIISPNTVVIQKSPSESESSTPIANGTELGTTDGTSGDAISSVVETETAVVGVVESHREADKNQVQVDGDGGLSTVEQPPPPVADNESIVVEENSSQGVTDQLTGDTVDEDSATASSAIISETSPVTANMEAGPDVMDPVPPLVGDAAVEDVTDDDVDLLLAVVGDSVESDFEELVKAQIEQFDDDNAEQIQQIHERIIVGIEGSNRNEDGAELGGEVVEEVVREEMKEDLTIGGESDGNSESVLAEDVPDGVSESTEMPNTDEQQANSNQEPTNSSQLATALAATAPLVPRASNSSNSNDIDFNDDPGKVDQTTTAVTSMDQLNNVVTTTTTVTAIASTVHQSTGGSGGGTASATGILINSSSISSKLVPPAFSRLPPDGHEFPPNFSEPTPIVGGMTVVTQSSSSSSPSQHQQQTVVIGSAMTLTKGDKHSSYDDIPDLPKSHPPAVPRKVFRQDLVLKALDQNHPDNQTTFKKPPIFPSPARSNSLVPPTDTSSPIAHKEESRRRSFDIHEINKPPSRISLVGSNWRKDEKSERSVRDKIAMFSNGSGGGGGGGGGVSENEGHPTLRKYSKDFTKSSENLLGSESGFTRKAVDPIEAYATLRKKAHSVENLDDVDSVQNVAEFRAAENGAYKTKFGLETSKPVVLGKAYSVENLNPSNGTMASNGDGKLDNGSMFGNAKILSRTTSFSGYSNGNSLATINNNVEERRKSSITSLLEQRKKSMSKLRGLVIPEKVPETEVLPDSKIIGLPIIKSKDSEKILSSNVLNKIPENSYNRKTATLPTPAKSNGSSFQPMIAPKPAVTELGGTYKSIFRNLNGSSPKSELKTELDEQGFRRPLPPVPPAKPPRTSLVYPPSKDQQNLTTEDESDDSDSVMSSRISSPPVSPVAPSSPEKYVLTRTLSSETNTSITSSNSTLTSSSGSQASCSSVGSTPAIDMSRRISKSSSNEMTMNRKNVLASAKSRSGRGDLKIEDAANGKAKRYEDGDSTDGYEEEERRKSKSKPRGSIGSGKSNGFDEKELTHYKVVDTVDSIVDKVIKVASYVEVVSDVEEDASVETEVVVPMQKPVEVIKEKIGFATAKNASPVVESGSPNSMTDLAKWVRHEAAKAIVAKEVEAPARPDVKKFARSFSEQISKAAEEIQTPTKRELRSSVDTKKLNLAEIRKSFEAKSNSSTVVPAPVKIVTKESTAPVPKSTPTVNSSHDRFSSWDSLASSSSGVSSLQTNSLLGNAVVNCSGSSQTLQSTPSDYGSFSSLGSSHSLITPQDLQLIIEEADPPLATPEAFVIVLQRETPESSIGITLAGGSDYEAKEITIHKILNNSPAEKDGRLRRGDRILSINGLSMRGLTHRESLSVLKTPRPEVVMVITRSKSLVIDNSTLSKTKRPSLGSLSSLAEKNEIPDYERKIKIQHKASRSLDLDLDIVSNEAESVFDGTASEDGLLSADESKCSSITPASDGIASPIEGSRVIEILKDGAGLGFSIEGGFDSPTGNKPLMIKKIFMGGAAEKSGLLKAGEEIVAINDISIERMTRIQVWNMMKKLPNGNVRIMLK